LGTKVVNFRRLDLGEDINKIGTIAEITIMQLEFVGVCALMSMILFFSMQVLVCTYVHVDLRKDDEDDLC
jgi:hypothetical protein